VIGLMMPDYPWKRFWCPRDGSFRVDSDEFLLDPQEELGTITNPQAKPLEALASTHFLGLLGEAGSGKTQTLKSEYAAVAGNFAKAGDESTFLSLRDIGNGADLDRAVFDAGWFKAWLQGDRTLHLFLDALDEASAFYPQVASRLLNRLSDLPLRRLFVRMTCRTASWPRVFDTELRGLLEKASLGDESYAVLELLPLRRRDVESAAATEGLDAVDFVTETVKKGVVALASRPLTLRFLLASYKGTNSLPSSMLALYKTGCSILAFDANDARRDTGTTGNLDSDQRLSIAERIAAITMLANRQAIWTGLSSERPSGDVSLEDIRGIELFDGRRLEVSDSVTGEVVGTALFTLRGESRSGWSHQTFGEFLAARYLARHELTTSQIRSLICTPNDSAGTVRPQLGGVAAWLASMREDIQSVILKSDPAVLLLSDSATLNSEVRRRLIAGLLQKFENAELVDREGTLFRLYAKLSYPGMAEQIREAVSAPKFGLVAKREAIAMARACELGGLSGFFADLALDGAAPIQLRKSAALTVADADDSPSKLRLAPLAAGLPEDTDDELKGAALRALWPTVVAVQEILPYLTRRKQPNHFGLYELFLLSLADKVPAQDIPLLLRWISGLDQTYSLSYSFGQLASRILHRAWDHADAPNVMTELPGALRSTNRLHFQESKTDWGKPTARCRLLVDRLVKSFESRQDAREGWPWGLGIPDPSDFEWMLARLCEDAVKRQPIWLELLGHTFGFDDARKADALLEAAQHSGTLAAEFEWCLGSVDLGSTRAERDRSTWLEREKWKELRESRQKDGKLEIIKLLESSERGEQEVWVRVPTALAITPEGHEPGGFPPIDLASTHGWLSADLGTRERILRAAEGFLRGVDPKTSEWLGKNRWSSDISAGIAGFGLLQRESPESLLGLSVEIWERWAPTIVTFPFLGQKPAAATLRRTAYANAPNAVLDTLATAIDAEDKERGWTFATEHVDDFWDDRLASLLISKLQRPGLKDGTFENLIRKLLEHGNEVAQQVAVKVIADAPSAEPTERRKVISVTVMLFAKDAHGTWLLIRPVLETNQEFAREFFVELARDGRPDHVKLFEGLEEPQAAELYLRLAELFPHSEDRLVNGFVGPDDEGRMFRDSLLGWLEGRGTRAACDAISSIAERLPHLPWFKWVSLEANQARRRNAPNWPDPADILKIATDTSRRLVRDAADLLEVVAETLTKLETELQGEIPAARQLWDKNASTSLYWPWPESDISDYVKGYLDRELHDRGVVANREVQIHRRERTDVHVDAVVDRNGGSPDVVTAIIEVKGCWNSELLTAIGDQLVGKYLTNNRCSHGIYLVFWFDCDAWDLGDPRAKGRPRFASLDELRSLLDRQAAEQRGFSIRSLVLDARLKR
jgi:hypothetical protein